MTLSDARRVIVVALLLALTAAGIRARGAFTHTALAVNGRTEALALGVAEGVAVVALILVLVFGRPERTRKEDDDEPVRLKLPWWVRPAGVLLALSAVVAPFAILIANRSRRPQQPLQFATARGPLPGASALATQAEPSAGAQLWAVAAGAIGALTILIVFLVLMHRRRAALGGPARTPRQLAARLAEASAALRSSPDPRAAIIACYAALERGFAAAGTEPHAADTPAEVLSRAARAGLVRSGAAATLTALFRRARYSIQPMARADAADAADALDRLRADLGPDQ